MNHSMLYDYNVNRKYPHRFRMIKIEVGYLGHTMRLAIYQKLSCYGEYILKRTRLDDYLNLPSYQYDVFFAQESEAVLFKLNTSNEKIFWNLTDEDNIWWSPLNSKLGLIMP